MHTTAIMRHIRSNSKSPCCPSWLLPHHPGVWPNTSKQLCQLCHSLCGFLCLQVAHSENYVVAAAVNSHAIKAKPLVFLCHPVLQSCTAHLLCCGVTSVAVHVQVCSLVHPFAGYVTLLTFSGTQAGMLAFGPPTPGQDPSHKKQLTSGEPPRLDDCPASRSRGFGYSSMEEVGWHFRACSKLTA